MEQQESTEENDADPAESEVEVHSTLELLLNEGAPLEQALEYASRLSQPHTRAEAIIPLSESVFIDDDNEVGVQLNMHDGMHGALFHDSWYSARELLRLHTFLSTHVDWLRLHQDELEMPTDRVGHYVSPAQAAQLTNIAERTWRQRASDGRISGAIKIGRRQWLLPRNIVIQSQQEKGTKDV